MTVYSCSAFFINGLSFLLLKLIPLILKLCHNEIPPSLEIQSILLLFKKKKGGLLHHLFHSYLKYSYSPATKIKSWEVLISCKLLQYRQPFWFLVGTQFSYLYIIGSCNAPIYHVFHVELR